MKKYLSFTALLLLGILLGAAGSWVSSYLPDPEKSSKVITFEKLLTYSPVQIQDNNFSCEGGTGKNVGAVIGSIFDNNNQYKRNKISMGCFETICALSISDCKPWQPGECSSRFLRFELDAENEIIPSSFVCFDMP